MPIILKDGNIVCGSEVSFLTPDEENYPQLMRLHLDFDFRVLSLSNPAKANPRHHNAIIPSEAPTANSRRKPRYLITFNTHQREDVPTITPVFASLPELERYANDNIVDILNNLIVDTQEE